MRNTHALSVALLLSALLAAPAAEAQNFAASPTYGAITLSSGFTPDPHTRSLTAGGSQDLDMGECTYGQVANAPDFNLNYTAGGTFPLYIYATSDADVMLLVNTPDGHWFCNDDGYTGLNPLIYFAKPMSGRYDIWVGTYGSDLASATLYVSELDPGN